MHEVIQKAIRNMKNRNIPCQNLPHALESDTSVLLTIQAQFFHFIKKLSYLKKELKLKSQCNGLADESPETKVYQILPEFSQGDAVGNDTIALHHILQQAGYAAYICAQSIKPEVKHMCINIKEVYIEKKDIIIYHKSIGSPLARWFLEVQCQRKIMIYHNITPSHFFINYNYKLYSLTKYGRDSLLSLVNHVDECWADSEFNKQELDQIGFRNTKVLPIIIDFSAYKQDANAEIVKKYNDGKTNILFVGRVAPNKKQEDIIIAFHYYKKYIDPQARLFLVGSYAGMNNYYNELLTLLKKLDLEDVYFTGHIPFADILAYYKTATVFLCLSEHEGFCVPLVESMYFRIPILAYNAAAIAETLQNGGILVSQKDPKLIAELIHLLVSDNCLRTRIIKNQEFCLTRFQHDKIRNKFIDYFAHYTP
ncbi:glycosyltransferase family 4 protein [Sporomusa termitida]|uniref:D-inositol-3-phosphate glycosyltransferase n=1 Tax=Sporomusa termitida TaxID=2377 RepID=A0A517DXF7_9FIRM|nr:glycosyltransferase family 4 protein [Sporomusa termitida]QDR82040.1 D-inositol-3-phosphate glycosyltransferase [Sporomusa termitida]